MATDIPTEVRRIIREQLDVDEKDIKPESSFIDDLGADSLGLVELVLAFEEAFEIITRVWTEEVFSYEGKFWSYKDVALWRRPVQQPRPEIWTPVVSSKESIEFAARNDIRITPGLAPGGLQDDIIAYYAKCLAANGRKITLAHSMPPRFNVRVESAPHATHRT